MSLLAAAALAMIVLTGCGTGTEDDPTGHSWELVELDGSTVVEGTVIDLLIENDEASGSSGCNSYTGEATVSDGEITLGPEFAVTFMACEEDVMNQEQRYIEAMTRVTTYEMAAGELLLLDDQGITVLAFEG